MKYFFVFLLSLINLCGFAQFWKCTYSDSAIFIFPDSLKSKLQSALKEQKFPEDLVAAADKKVSSGPQYRTRTRHVYANTDSTEIEIEVSEKGSLRIDVFATQYFLLKKNELFAKTIPHLFYYDSLVTSPAKDFKATGRKRVIFSYSCAEYLSTDSSSTIWVTDKLCPCINPGVLTGNIKGAVLFYELRSGQDVLIRCRITSLQKTKRKYG